MRRTTLPLMLIIPACLAHAEQGRTLDVTIYGGNLALVEDTRPIDFAKGRSEITFPDISAMIRPETASLTADGVTVIEQNFDFDLLTPQKLMEKALGRTVTIVRTNPGSGAQQEETATVLSTQQGVVLKIGDHIEVLRDDGIPTRVIFDKVPDNLRARPTLSILAASTHAGTRPATLTYMTNGLTWAADYVVNYDEKAHSADLQGWVTLTNNTSVSYDDATVRIAAGALSSGGLTQLRPINAGADDNATPTLFDLPEPVTIANRQAKQVGMADLKAIAAEKIYRSVWKFDSGIIQHPEQTDVVLRFDSRDKAGKNWRLPRGALRAFIRDAKGDLQYVGEARIADIPAGGKIVATIAHAFDIQVKPTITAEEQFGAKGVRRTTAYDATNASDSAVAIEIELDGTPGDSRVLRESVPGIALDAYRHQWTITVPAHGATTLETVVEYGR